MDEGTANPDTQCPSGLMQLNIGLQALAAVLSFPALIRRPRRFLVWLVAWVLNLTAFRLNTCINCDYYGRDCHLGWGLLTAKLFERTGEPDREAFRRRIPANVAFMFLVFLLPVPAMKDKRKLLSIYLSVLMAMNLLIPMACMNCTMNDVCPMGKRVNALAGRQCSPRAREVEERC